MHIRFTHTYEHIISVDNLLGAWREFIKGKRNKTDVQEYSQLLMLHIQKLHESLKRRTYTHGGYEAFKVSDPKPRDIHKASVKDRLLHHALYRQLYPFFDRTFIPDSYSCRERKGTHKAMNKFKRYAGQVSINYTRTCWVLKCDIRKFFASVDHIVLKSILRDYIEDKNILWLLDQVIDSFDSGAVGRGLPLGNLTSQLLVNIYMNEFDQYVKHALKVRYYIRYADDFVILIQNRKELDEMYRRIATFLNDRLKLELHPDKCSIKTFASGVDFLGWVHFPTHRVLRTNTKRRMLTVTQNGAQEESLQSYRGMLAHGNTHRLLNSLDTEI
jgi:RNA-directed DNA polymerase